MFNQFLIDAEEPLLFHAGQKWVFPALRDAMATIIDPAKLRWITFSHYEADESGTMNEWLRVAPEATIAHGTIGVRTSIADQADRPPHSLTDGDILDLGGKRVRYIYTPHVPHGWDAGVLFEETQKTLLCSDLFHQTGDVEPVTSTDVVGRSHQAMKEYQAGILADYVPYTPLTARNLKKLADLKPKTLAIMHGSSFTGDCAKALDDLNVALRDVYGQQK